MGGNQSRNSDDESVPRYSYHESVLKEAEVGFVSCDANSAQHANDDEQYFSTEEGESVHSITPERTRPESSSGDNSTDESEGDEDDSAEESSRHEADDGANMSPELQVPGSPDTAKPNTGAGIRQEHNPEKSSLGIFHEKEIIRPEIETTSNVVSELGNNSRLNRNFNNRNAATPQPSRDQPVHISDSSPDISIQSSRSSALDNTAFENKEPVVNLGKRKMFQDPAAPLGEESAVPRKVMLTRNSSKRKRLGYTESTDSEVDEKVEEETRKQNKKGRVDTRSIKEGRRRGHDSRERDSDERRYGPQRRTRKARHSYGSGRTESDDEEEESDVYGRKFRGHRNKTSRRSKRSKHSSDESSSCSRRRSRSRKRRRSSRYWRRESDSEEDRVEHRQACDNVVINNRDNEDEPVHQTRVSVSVQEKAKDTAETDSLSGKVIGVIDLSSQCHTCKMGNQSFRNVFGKVLPLRQQNQVSSGGSIVFSSKSGRSDIFGHGNSEAEIRNLKFVNSDLTLQEQILPVVERTSLSNLKGLQQQKDIEEIHSVQGNLQESPFKNVVLTPPSVNHLDNGRPLCSSVMKRAANNDVEEHSSDMEVEEVDVTVESHTTNNPFSNLTSPNTKVMPQGKRRVRTAAAQFRKFWLEKKKNIGQNLKSLWSSVSSPPERPLSSSNRGWQTFSSPSDRTQNMYPSLRSSHSLQVESPTTYLNQDNWQGLSVSSPVLDQRSLTQLPSVRSLSASQVPSTHLSPALDQRSLTQLPSLRGLSASQVPSTHLSPSTLSATVLQPHHPRKKMSSCSGPQLGSLSTGVKGNQFISPINRTSQVTCEVSSPTNRKIQQSSVMLPAKDAVEWLPQTVQYQVLNCRLADAVDLSISTGDLADQKTAAIVNWTDGALTHAVTNCSRNIAAKAGALMRAACNDYIQSKGGNLEAPDVLITPAGGRFERAVEVLLHVVEPNWVQGDEEGNRRALMEVFANCLRFASERLGLDGISFPLIGDGTFPFDTCAESFLDAVLVFLSEQMNSKSSNLSHVQLIIPDIAAANFAADLVKSRLQQICSNRLESIVASVYSRYYSQKQLETHQSADDRSLSGRPRLKRPRL